ncbi:MAG: hypothetical protein ACFFBJ_11215 [Promethearchaeota archaeon]
MTRTRIYVDSVLDRDHVRVLISTDGKTETAIVMEKEALEKLLRDKEDFWESVNIRRKGETKRVKMLKRKIEGEVVTFPENETPFFEKLVKDYQRPPKLLDEKLVKKVKKQRIKDGLKKPTRSRGTLRNLLLERQEELRKREPQRRIPRRRRVDR